MSNAVAPTDLLATVSASRLGTFQQCRLKFYFRYVLQLKKAKTPALHVGSTVHAVLQEWSLARWQARVCDEVGLKTCFDQTWQTSQTEDPVRWEEGEEAGAQQGAWQLLTTYFQQTPIPPNEKPEAVEVRVEADLSPHGLPRLVGIMDLVRKGGCIVDFKTAAQTPNPEKTGHLHETQLSCYGILYREATGQTESGFELHHLVKLKTPKLVVTSLRPMGEPQRLRFFRLLDSYVRAVEAEDYYPSPSPMACACCEFFNECRRWS